MRKKISILKFRLIQFWMRFNKLKLSARHSPYWDLKFLHPFVVRLLRKLSSWLTLNFSFLHFCHSVLFGMIISVSLTLPRIEGECGLEIGTYVYKLACEKFYLSMCVLFSFIEIQPG